jgi:NADPH:quinone reductase-like Zn-dependent oxidoreductase
MKAAIYRRYGPPDVVRIAELPAPVARPNEILVKILATTVSAGDSRLRSANVPPGWGLLLRLGFGILGPRKKILGWEFSGEVAAVGSSVKRFTVGDDVFAARLGCHAEYVTVPEDMAAPIPRNLTFGEAAALPFGGLTSLFYLRDKAHIQPGERVLVNGASGAVGSAAVQLAKHFGARVTGVCSAANAAMVKALGAEHVIDYSREDFAREREAYDIIVDTVGNCPFTRCQTALAAGGRLLLVVATLSQLIGAQLWPSRAGRRVLAGTGSVRSADLLFLKDLAETGRFKPVIDRTYPFERIAEAHAYVDTGHKKGSVVISLESDPLRQK